MSDVDKYRKLLGLSGARQSPHNIDGSVSYDLKGEVARRLAALKKDLTWTDLPKVDMKSLPNKKFTADDATAMAMDLMQTTPAGALAGVIKEKGGNWLGDSVKKAMEKLKEPLGETDPAMLARIRQRMGDSKVGSTGESLGKWVDGPLTKYTKNRMATPDDEIRKLADQGILHVDPEQLNFVPEMYGKWPHPNQSFMANPNSEAAKIWEGVSDNSLSIRSAREILESGQPIERAIVAGQNPWLSKVDPDTQVNKIYDHKSFANDVGFDHMLDELSNALDETSGLPQHLRLTPEGLQGLSVEEAVRKVDGINKFRAEKAQKANARFAQAEGIPVHKSYDEGWKWLEYKKPDEVEGLAKGETGYALPTGDSKDPYKYFEDIEDAKKHRLGEWLKQEGDTMGHCVGGYCDDVTSGNTRILSLRDHEGKSVATVELQATKEHMGSVNDLVHAYSDELTGVDTNNLRSHYELFERMRAAGIDPNTVFEPSFVARAKPWSIAQIKGPGNKKPKPEAIPFIQDFVKSSKYPVIGDLQNSDLLPKSSLTKEEQLLIGSDYLTMDEIKKLREGKPWTPIDTDPEW